MAVSTLAVAMPNAAVAQSPINIFFKDAHELSSYW